MEYKYEFEQDGDVLVIHTFDDEEQLPTYEIPINELVMLSHDGENLSHWIEHLSHKKWITYDGLYQLAREIRKYHPDSEISWRKTFTFIEKLRYFVQKEQEAGLKDKKGEKTSMEVVDSVFNSIELRRDLRNEDGFDENIKGHVDAKLQEENIKE